MQANAEITVDIKLGRKLLFINEMENGLPGGKFF